MSADLEHCVVSQMSDILPYQGSLCSSCAQDDNWEKGKELPFKRQCNFKDFNHYLATVFLCPLIFNPYPPFMSQTI